MQLSLPLCQSSLLTDVRERLLRVYGPQRDTERHDPTSQLFKAMASSCTRDAVSQAAYERLHEKFAWEDLPVVTQEAVAAVIAAVTRPNEKAIQIVAAARIIRSQRGSVDLDFLVDWPTDAAFAWLDRLPGVGSKIAAAVLNFSSLRKPLLVVDRHILRVSKRLGLLPPKADFDRGFRLLMRHVPAQWDADHLYELHWLMKMHGQQICRHHQTACASCALATLCPSSLSRQRKQESGQPLLSVG
ncbi:MAG: endonuclease III [Pseudomonadota bacterium]